MDGPLKGRTVFEDGSRLFSNIALLDQRSRNKTVVCDDTISDPSAVRAVPSKESEICRQDVSQPASLRLPVSWTEGGREGGRQRRKGNLYLSSAAAAVVTRMTYCRLFARLILPIVDVACDFCFRAKSGCSVQIRGELWVQGVR